MIASILIELFRKNTSKSAYEYALQYQKHPTKSSIVYLINHYINEANEKINRLEEFIMPKVKKQNNFGSTKFCAISLDTAQKDIARKWLEKNGKELDTFASIMVRDGWKASFSWDSYNDCFIASSTCRDEADTNYDVCCTSRSDNMWDAMLLNYYKIYVLYKDQTLPTERAKENWG